MCCVFLYSYNYLGALLWYTVKLIVSSKSFQILKKSLCWWARAALILEFNLPERHLWTLPSPHELRHSLPRPVCAGPVPGLSSGDLLSHPGGGVPPSLVEDSRGPSVLCVHLSRPRLSVLWTPAALACSDIPPLGGGTEGRQTCQCWALGPRVWGEKCSSPLWCLSSSTALNSNSVSDSFRYLFFFFSQFSSAAQSCLTLCNPMDCSTPGFPVLHHLPEFAQTHVHQVSDAIQPSHPLSSPSPPAFNLSQHQGLFKWVSSSHQVAQILEFQLQHQSFQWTPRTDLL